VDKKMKNEAFFGKKNIYISSWLVPIILSLSFIGSIPSICLTQLPDCLACLSGACITQDGHI